jgi:hypothetical protein
MIGRLQMSIPSLRRGREDSIEAHLQRARNQGYASGASEARLFKSTVGKGYGRSQALEWLGRAVAVGRTDLAGQHAHEDEIDAWDMSCRIAFMVATV